MPSQIVVVDHRAIAGGHVEDALAREFADHNRHRAKHTRFMADRRLERAVAVSEEHVDRAGRGVGIVEVEGAGRGDEIESAIVVQVPGRDIRELFVLAAARYHAPAEGDPTGVDEDVDRQRARDREVAAAVAVEIAARRVSGLISAPLSEELDGGLKRQIAIAAIQLQRVVELGYEDVAAAVAVEVGSDRPDLKRAKVSAPSVIGERPGFAAVRRAPDGARRTWRRAAARAAREFSGLFGNGGLTSGPLAARPSFSLRLQRTE